MFYSTDGGEPWNSAAALPQGGTCCDPTVDWKSDGTLAHTATLGNCGGSRLRHLVLPLERRRPDLERSGSGDARRSAARADHSGSDKEFLHVDKSAPRRTATTST